MTQNTSISAIACAPGALPGGPSRTRFFDGMFLTQSDLENEQRFWRLKRRLTNRALGDGVVWGLRLSWAQQRHTFTLSPGYALDCCGNDLIVECPVDISEAELWSRADPSLRDNTFRKPHIESELLSRRAIIDHRTRHACIVLQYTECPEEARPVHRDACGGMTSACETSRVRETARLLLVPPPTPRLTPPEQFLADLESWRDSLPIEVRNALFPPQGSGPVTPTTGVVPMTVNVAIPNAPGAPVASASIPPPAASGSVTQPTLSTTQTVGSSTQPGNVPLRTAVVTFELRPTTGWGFMSGKVLDQGRTVEEVTPPVAPSMYWAFDLAVPVDENASARFEFRVDNLDIGKTFGGSQHGKVTLLITGRLSAETIDNATAKVSVSDLTVTTLSAEVSLGTNDQGCLRELVPWGAIVDPTDGRRIAGSLVLSSLYAFLSEVVRRGGSPGWTQIATLLYGGAWYALYGVNGFARVDEQYRKKLSQLVLDLYRRWCDALAYPGPRCADEHHGVYLGCVEIDCSGRIVSFDMWEQRRYVVTGALLGYWARQFGLAPLDVIAGRFASAICCLAGQTPIVLPPREGQLYPGIGGERPHDRFHIGTTGTVTDFAKLHRAPLRWVPLTELATRAPQAFMGADKGDVFEVLASQIENGGSIAIALARATTGGGNDKIRNDVIASVRRGDLRVTERGRALVADFAVEVLSHSSPTVLAVSDSAANLAKKLGDNGVSTADVLAVGAERLASQYGGEPKVADELVDAAEKAQDGLVTALVTTTGPSVDRKSFESPDLAGTLGEALKRQKLRFDMAIVMNAAKTVAAG